MPPKTPHDNIIERRPPSNHNSQRIQSPKQPRNNRNSAEPSTSSSQHMGMTELARYNSNLKVLRRRDKSITSIFDQFSHVCVYHYNAEDNKWEKHGFEGSMFLYERDTYPPYGLYVLNRQGSEDFNQCLHPEDKMGIHGPYLMIRSFEEFTRSRIQRAGPNHNKFSDVYAFDTAFPDNQKGKCATIGLWMFNTGIQEHLNDVLLRLYEYVKRNMPYPDEYKHGPDNPRIAISHIAPTITSSPVQSLTASSKSGLPLQKQHASSSSSEIDQLFAKLPPPKPVSSGLPMSTSKMTVAALFATMTASDDTTSNSDTVTATDATPRPSLLDTLFASASSSSGSDSTLKLPILSPKPTSTSLPQILTQDVISSVILGLPPSRTNSSASSSAGLGSSGEGDDEDCLDTSDDPETSMMLEADDEDILVGTYPTSGIQSNGGLNGDATPRAPAHNGRFNYSTTLPSVTPKSTNYSSALAKSNSVETIPDPGRQLVPFHDESELWPYDPNAEQADDIPVLNFEDMSALNDLDSFKASSVQPFQNGHSHRHKSGKRNVDPGWDLPSLPPIRPSEAPGPFTSTITPSKPYTNGASPTKVKGKSSSSVDPSVARASLLDTLMASSQTHPPVEKNEFVREVLTLIHTDKSFVENLWKDYLTRV